MSILLAKGRTLFIADTNVTEMPDAEELVEIAIESGPRGGPTGLQAARGLHELLGLRQPDGRAVREGAGRPWPCSDAMGVDFEYEGEMPPELALDPAQHANYPFMRLTGPANVLVMPAIHSASISTKLVQTLGGATVIGPILLGLSKSVQICPLSASVSRILNMAMMAAYEQPAAQEG